MVIAFAVLLAGVAVFTAGIAVTAAASTTVAAAPDGTAGGGTLDATAANATTAPTDPRIVELYPNPTTERNRGEYLVVALPRRGNWSLSDGYHDASIPSNASGLVALSTDPERSAEFLADAPAAADRGPAELRRLDGYFPLSASGDRIELRHDGVPVDIVEYGRVSDGHRWRADWGEWRPRGYDPREPARIEDASVTPFVLPDSPDVPVETLRGTEDRLLLAGYTLESDRTANVLVDAVDRGVDVRVLLEGSPVGGFSARSARLVDRLVAAGVEVRILDGDAERFRFHHAKYAVADDRAVVLTENWKPSGTGGRTNRGWGVVAEPTPGSESVPRNPSPADALAALFRADAAATDARPWREFEADTEFHDSGRANDTYPTRFEPPAPARADVTLLTAPGNAADRIVARIDAADDRVLAVVPRTGGPNDRIVRALRRAADRGVDVHLLLSGAWYDRDDNRDLATTLDSEPIAVAVSEPRGRYGKIHAKGLVVDDAAIVGSLNWNEGAATENREVLLAVDDAAVADFYARAYAADWRGGGVHLPVEFLGGLGVAVAGAWIAARREIRFA
ncbi:phospholipase D-like domain-containing protein [Halorubrum laminariae]|uniref:Phospholipase D-like domain-containing protein n=1 Tax=Halorubrum laminariae TaxID=1433523 RepID=A0ABD6BYG7_9EURY